MRATEDSEILTLAAVRDPSKDRPGYALFNERQQLFELPRAKRQHESVSRRLREAHEATRPVRVMTDPAAGLVRAVEHPSDREVDAFLERRVLAEDVEAPHRIDVASLDPTTFNIVDLELRWHAFNLCRRTIPSYKKAKEVFDYCAAQSCHLPGPPDISHCIPFQYVIDGCYARAHKMRQIIEEEYNYCSEKVFSFANQNNDTLAVKANMWGGCCVFWWYHVAPLVRVRVRLQFLSFSFQIVLAMVIDPSMFTKPVLLSTWLGAQQSRTCDEDANVSMYSIQPSSAYWPANYAGTAFDTDPDYSKTHSTLVNYKNLTTC